jgi:RNA processing factor Prp31
LVALYDLSEVAGCVWRPGYRFEVLQGIIFGMNMSAEDRAGIVRIIAAKCAQTGRTDFEFHQAYYSRLAGKVEAALWDLVKFHPAETAPPSPPKATS